MTSAVIPWLVFISLIAFMLMLDLGIFRHKKEVVSSQQAIIWSCIWIGLALLFNIGVFLMKGPQAGLEFLTGYLIEESLSLDNLFIFVLIFKYFSVPSHLYHRVLFWGILGAIIMRLILIFVGLKLLHQFSWIFYIFGFILIYSGFHMLKQQEHLKFLSQNKMINAIKRFIPITEDYISSHFLTRMNGRFAATPLFLALITIEVSDLVFAIDSIPAIFAVTLDPFIVYTSNIFAILGLRSLFFVISHLLSRFYYLKYALSTILIFVGCKMLLHQTYKIPILASLGGIFFVFLAAIIASIQRKSPLLPK